MMTAVAIMAGLPMIGGIISSTLLTLIVIPAIYVLVKGAELGKPASAAKPGYAART